MGKRRMVIHVLLAVWAVSMAWVPSAAAQQLSCRGIQRINEQGTTGKGTVITVSTTAVEVMAANTARCGVTIVNSGATNMVCAPFGASFTLSATAGWPILASASQSFTQNSQNAFFCLTASGSTTVNVWESVP